ncbi:YjjG family noncanonical pyrimidine nucleotidase [Streptococcus ovuberis]|uniref:Noncanonical pyrimidine nucleotidase, YjjG family n=1 Tax=Streptococcus ovuberis TaxID=1936207 RepID=A0A7X6MYZ8_9STRE|nr:YjjG family noncanonical pyrimidine nucleotidase [Streptococcus ovuberis]NKZ20466.1 noncanonical pyrimidine nucleotidase, YjjG family [Streptococcus ovuberis]
MDCKFLLFDLDHTLLDFDAAEEVALQQLFAQYHVTDIAAYKAAYRTINSQLWRQLEVGKISKKELVDTRFSLTFAQFNKYVDGRELAHAYEQYLSQQGQIYQGADQLLSHLRACGYRIFAVTNGIAKIQKGRLKASGLLPYFEQVFISEELGTAKPSPAFFEKMAEQIEGFRQEEAVMIGDSLTADIPGGIAAGLKTVWVNFKGQQNQTPYQADYEVRTYQELLHLLS